MRSSQAYWDPDKPEIIELLKKDPEQLNKDELIKIVKELDRRFMQLWDKVSYERDNNLVNYLTPRT